MSVDVDPDEVEVKVVRRETRCLRVELVDHTGRSEHFSDQVTVWARVSGAAPMRKTRTISFEVVHLVLKFHRANGRPWELDLTRASVQGPRITQKGPGGWHSSRYFFIDDVPEWLKVFASETLATLS